MTQSYNYEAASTAISDIFAVINTHFSTVSTRYSIDFSSPEGIVISPTATPPEIIDHQISIRHDGTKIITAVDRLKGFTAAGSISGGPTGGSGVASPEVVPQSPTIGSLTVYIIEEVDCITVLTYQSATKRRSDWGLHCGIGFIPGALNDDDFGIYGTINLNGRPEITSSSLGQWQYNVASNSTGIFEGFNGNWYAIFLNSSNPQNSTLGGGSVFIPRPMLIYTRRMGDSASFDFTLGYMKYIYWMPGNDLQFARTKAENASRAYLYFDGNSDAQNVGVSVKWEQGVVPG